MLESFHNFLTDDWINVFGERQGACGGGGDYMKTDWPNEDNISGRPLDNQTWQTEGKAAPMAKVKLLSMKTKLWKLLLWPAVHMPSLIVQWPVRIFHF